MVKSLMINISPGVYFEILLGKLLKVGDLLLHNTKHGPGYPSPGE
jgi:hypothetical protein